MPKKKRVCRFSQAAYHRFWQIGSHPLRIPAPFLLTNRTKLRNVRRRNRSHPRLHKAFFVSFRWIPEHFGSQTNKLLETNFSSICKLTASKLAGYQDAEPGTSTQGRSIPQLLHAGVVWIRKRFWRLKWRKHGNAQVFSGDETITLGWNILDELVKQLSTWSFFYFIFVLFKIQWVSSVFVFFCSVVWESFQEGV